MIPASLPASFSNRLRKRALSFSRNAIVAVGVTFWRTSLYYQSINAKAIAMDTKEPTTRNDAAIDDIDDSDPA